MLQASYLSTYASFDVQIKLLVPEILDCKKLLFVHASLGNYWTDVDAVCTAIGKYLQIDKKIELLVKNWKKSKKTRRYFYLRR